jgi:hypothetical protein
MFKLLKIKNIKEKVESMLKTTRNKKKRKCIFYKRGFCNLLKKRCYKAGFDCKGTYLQCSECNRKSIKFRYNEWIDWDLIRETYQCKRCSHIFYKFI